MFKFKHYDMSIDKTTTVEMPSDLTWPVLIQEFTGFLRGCGYNIPLGEYQSYDCLDSDKFVNEEQYSVNQYKKYKILKDCSIIHNNKILYRIMRLKDNLLGGYIQGEHNLLHEGDCFIYDNAKVYDDAAVSGNARVCNDAEVFDSARVYDNAVISRSVKILDSAQVYGNAQVFDAAVISGNAEVRDNALVYGRAWIYGNAQVFDDTVVSDNKEVFGDEVINKEVCL